jgi:hypothetical protein
VRSCLVSRPLRPKPQRALNNPSISASLPASTVAAQPPAASLAAPSGSADVLALSEVVAKLRIAVALSSSAATGPQAGSTISDTSAAAPAANKPDESEEEASKLSPPSADGDAAA